MDMDQYMLETVVLPQIGGRFSPITVLYISCFCCIEHRYLALEIMFFMKSIGFESRESIEQVSYVDITITYICVFCKFVYISVYVVSV